MGLALPYEIWSLVAKFIPERQFLRLYGVNWIFFDLVMRELYHEVKIYHTGHESTRRCLKNMSPAAARRVRTLILRPQLFRDQKLSSTRKLFNHIRHASKPTNATLIKHFSYMTDVTSLTIECYPSDDFPLFKLTTPIVIAAWAAHGPQLRSLTLAIPLEAYAEVLPAALNLVSLEAISITLRTVYATTICEEIYPLITAFINRHAQLHTLSVDIPKAGVDPSRFFNNLDRFPQLNSLSIRHPLDRLRPQYSTGIDFFLSKHAGVLKEFSIQFFSTDRNYQLPSPDDFFSHPMFRVQLPNLQSLELGLCQWPGTSLTKSITENLCKFLQPMRTSLSSLTLCDRILTFPEVQCIASVLSGTGTQLRVLKIYADFLSCDLLDLLSQKLPGLHEFELSFDALSTEFCRDMIWRIYRHWALRHLKIPLYACHGKWKECRQVLKNALPSVITFNNLSGKEFCEDHDYMT